MSLIQERKLPREWLLSPRFQLHNENILHPGRAEVPPFPALLPETRQANITAANWLPPSFFPQAASIPHDLPTWGQWVVLGNLAMVTQSLTRGLYPQGAGDLGLLLPL